MRHKLVSFFLGILFVLGLGFVINASMQNGELVYDWHDVIFAWPQIVNLAPAQPYACDVSVRGNIIYIDDTNDLGESYLCFCGVDADDATYLWMRAYDPAVECFIMPH